MTQSADSSGGPSACRLATSTDDIDFVNSASYHDLLVRRSKWLAIEDAISPTLAVFFGCWVLWRHLGEFTARDVGIIMGREES